MGSMTGADPARCLAIAARSISAWTGESRAHVFIILPR